MSSQSVVVVPSILTEQPELPPNTSRTLNFQPAGVLTTEEGGNDPGRHAPQPQYVRELISEMKTFPEDIQALSVDPSLVAYLSQLFHNSRVAGQNGSFIGAVPPPTPAVTASKQRKSVSTAILRAMAVVAETLGLKEAWSLIRQMSPSPLSDISEAFRLYFGANISIFPYLVSLGGTMGAVVSSLPVAYLCDACVEMQSDAKDVAVNIILKQLVASDRSHYFGTAFGAAGSPSMVASRNKTIEQQLKELEDFSARHLSVSSYFRLAEVLWSFPVGAHGDRTSTSVGDDFSHHSPAAVETVTINTSAGVSQLDTELAAVSPQQGGDRQRFVRGSSLVQDLDLSPSVDGITAGPDVPPPPPPQVEIRSVIPSVVRLIVTFAQFTSTCCFSILIATNMQALFDGMALNTAMALSCAGLTVMLCALTPNTLATYAMLNNVGLLGSSLILIVATLLHDGESDGSTASTTSDDHIWIFFRTPTDAFMFFPTLLAYISPALFAIDVETNIARRCIQRVVAKLTGGRDKSLETPGALESPGLALDDTSAPEGVQGSDSRQNTIIPSSAMLLRRFHFVTVVSFVAAMIILLGFGEFIFVNFKSKTNAVVALSLQPGFMRTLLLWDLVLSIFACAALNVVGLPNILDDLRLAEQVGVAKFVPKPLERILLRVAIMIVVLLTLFVIPYFDLVASLVGCLGVNGFSLFLPVLFQLQAIRRRDAAAAGNDASAAFGSPRSPSALMEKSTKSATDLISWWEAFRRVPSARMKVTMLAMLSIGSLVLVTGVGSCVSQLFSRLSGQSV
jgi:hypothetical protein